MINHAITLASLNFWPTIRTPKIAHSTANVFFRSLKLNFLVQPFFRRFRHSIHSKHTDRVVVCQLESILHELYAARRQPLPGHDIVRQHRPGVGGNISCNYYRHQIISASQKKKRNGELFRNERRKLFVFQLSSFVRSREIEI